MKYKNNRVASISAFEWETKYKKLFDVETAEHEEAGLTAEELLKLAEVDEESND